MNPNNTTNPLLSVLVVAESTKQKCQWFIELLFIQLNLFFYKSKWVGRLSIIPFKSSASGRILLCTSYFITLMLSDSVISDKSSQSMGPGQTAVVSRAGSQAEHVAPGRCLLVWQHSGRNKDRETPLSITLKNHNIPAQLDDGSILLETMFCCIDKCINK